MLPCLISSLASIIGGVSRIVSASRFAPSGPSPRPFPSAIVLVPLAPTPLTTRTSPPDDTCTTTPRLAKIGGGSGRPPTAPRPRRGHGLLSGSTGEEAQTARIPRCDKGPEPRAAHAGRPAAAAAGVRTRGKGPAFRRRGAAGPPAPARSRHPGPAPCALARAQRPLQPTQHPPLGAPGCPGVPDPARDSSRAA